jgi:hypothetical protein
VNHFLPDILNIVVVLGVLPRNALTHQVIQG